VSVNGNATEDFVATWRYIHDIFDAAGATNVLWVWSPIAGAATPNRAVDLNIEEVYPGDEYVDWIGMSGFNFGTTQQPWGVAGWETFSQIFFASYTRMGGLANKPIVIAETASTEEGGDKAAWITEAFGSELPERFPNVRAVVWFNIVKETDWRVESSPESLRAFVTQASSPYLQGTVEG
jgi:mannan endo-1,4-beta-mannosidase